LSAVAIHGNKSQGARTRALDEFKQGAVRVLVATDIASRGLDIDELPHVVNYELPDVAEYYVHRIGRTGRAGRHGVAISLVSRDEQTQLRDIERLAGQRIPQRGLEGFVPPPRTDSPPRGAQQAPRRDTGARPPPQRRDNAPKSQPGAQRARGRGGRRRGSGGRDARV